MKSISLSVYQITIYKHLKKDDLENLSNFDKGKDFIKLVDIMFNSWRDNLTLKVLNDTENKKVSRLKRSSNADIIYHRHQNYIDGIIESGEYGTQEEIINIETGEAKYTKTKNEAALMPFYFMIYVEPNSNKGYLVLERIGNNGIFSVLTKAIRDFIVPQLIDQFMINFSPYLVPEILKINLAAVGGAKKVVLRGVDSSQFKAMKPDFNFSECTTEVSFIAPKNKFIQQVADVFNYLRGKNNNEPYKVNNIECQDVAFELDINGSRRTVTVARMTNIGMNIDITKHVCNDATGYPSYESLFEQANVIISYIISKKTSKDENT